MDIMPQFMVFFILVVAALVEIPVLYLLLRLLGASTYSDTSLSRVSMYAAFLMVVECYGGWKLAYFLEEPGLAWLATVPVALVAAVVFVWAFSLPLSRAALGGVVFLGLHVWIIPLLPQPAPVFPVVLSEQTDATKTRPAYVLDESQPIPVQWYSQLRCWQEVRLTWAPFLEKLKPLMTAKTDQCRIEQLKLSFLDDDAANPRMEVSIEGTSPGTKRSTIFRSFLKTVLDLEVDPPLMEQFTLDRFGPDIRVGLPEGTHTFLVRGYRYVSRPGDHSALNSLSQGAITLGIRSADDWMRVPHDQLYRHQWVKLRTSRILSKAGLDATNIKPAGLRGVTLPCGGQYLNMFQASFVLECSYDEMVNVIKQIESDSMTAWVMSLDVKSNPADPGQVTCFVFVGWPIWKSRELDAAVAEFLGKKDQGSLYDQGSGDDMNGMYFEYLQ